MLFGVVAGWSDIKIELTCVTLKRPPNIYQTNRSVGKTNMNEHSSRSHLVFTLTATGKNLVTGASTVGNLTLIDLAGFVAFFFFRLFVCLFVC